MNVNITFRHMEHTPALDKIIHEKSDKFLKWFGPGVDVLWICWIEGVDHCSEVSIAAGNDKYFAKAHSDDLYKTIDLVIHKIQNQIK
jgi:putative sigma-54 modulation protein